MQIKNFAGAGPDNHMFLQKENNCRKEIKGASKQSNCLMLMKTSFTDTIGPI